MALKMTQEPKEVQPVDYRPAMWGVQNRGVKVTRHGPYDVKPDRRHQQPQYPGYDMVGNTFEWIVRTAEEIHRKRELSRRVEDKPRLRKL